MKNKLNYSVLSNKTHLFCIFLLDKTQRMALVKVDNGEFMIGVPVESDGTISIETFNRLFPLATVFLFKRNHSNFWIEYVPEYIL
jgi:hypothetical protein